MPRIIRAGPIIIEIRHIYDLMCQNLEKNKLDMYSESYKEKQKKLNNSRGGLLNLLHNPPEDLKENHFLEDDEITTLHNLCVGLAFGFKNPKNNL